MKKNRNSSVQIPTVEEMRRDLNDPIFVSQMQKVEGFVNLHLTEAEVEEAELINEFLRPQKN